MWKELRVVRWAMKMVAMLENKLVAMMVVATGFEKDVMKDTLLVTKMVVKKVEMWAAKKDRTKVEN